MKNLFSQILILLTVFMTVSAFTYAQEAYNLQYKMEKGKSYRYKAETISKVTQEVMGREMTFDNNVNSIDRMTVADRSDNGNITLMVSFDSLKVHSLSPKDTTLILKDFTGKRTEVNLTKLGIVENKKVIDTLTGNSPLRKSFQNQPFDFIEFPNKEVKIGDNWKAQRTDTLTSPMGTIIANSDLVYTLAGKEQKDGRQCLKITYTAKVKTQGSGSMQGMELYIEGSGKSLGTVDFDPVEGVMVNTDSKVDLQMTIAVKGNQNMIIPVTQSSHKINTLITD